MIQHLQDLVDDVDLYGWEPVWAFHAVWLQQLEEGCVTWADEEVKLKYRRALVWHRGTAPSQLASAPSQQVQRKKQKSA